MKLKLTCNIIILAISMAHAQTHFKPVRGDLTNPMNFAITDAKVNGIRLLAGDEIGIFDGNICVGANVLTTDIGETFDTKLLFINAAMDYDRSPEKDGYMVGNPISFKIWYASQNKEISTVNPTYYDISGNIINAQKFECVGSAIVSLNATMKDFWEEHTSGGIAVQVMETGEQGIVKYVGYEYSEVIWKDFAGNETLITKIQKFPLLNKQSFLTNFPKGNTINSRFNNEILLFNEDEKQIGHIPFYYNPDKELLLCRNAILFLHNDDEMCKDGNIQLYPFNSTNPNYPKWYQEGWRYFAKGEYPVSMLIPPIDKMSQLFNKEPLLFVHGWEGTYPYWKDNNKSLESTVDLLNKKGKYNGWQIYYPGNMDIAHSAKCLKNDVEYLSKTYYNDKKVKIITHSMGGLVTAEFVTSNPFIANTYLDKILMTVPPIHGSLGANRFYKTFSGGLTEDIVEADNDAPCVMDMSIGSNFIINLHNRNWNEFFDFNLNGKISDNVFVLIGTTKEGYLTGIEDWIKSNFAEEAINHHDVTVAISSASLLDHNIGFATMFGNHDDGKFLSNIKDINFLPDFIDSYFSASTYENFIDNIANNVNIQAIVNPDKTVYEPSGQNLSNLKTNEINVDYQKGIVGLHIPESKYNLYHIYIDETSKSIGLSKFYWQKDKDPDEYLWFTNRTYSGFFKKNEYSGKFYFDGAYESNGSAIKLKNGKYKITFHPSLGINLSGVVDFNNCQTFYVTFESNSIAQNNSQSYSKTGMVSYMSLIKKAAIGFAQYNLENDTTFYVDDQVQTVNFTLQCWEALKNSVPITMKLKAPDENIIDQNSEGITFSIDSVSGIHQLLINNPMVGKWHIWAESIQPEAETMQYVAKAYFLSDIIAYNACDTNEVVAGNEFACKAGLKFNSLSLLDTTGIKVIATVTSPKGEQQILDISKNIIQTDTSFVFGSLIRPDTMGYYTVEVTFEGTYNGFKFERALIFQFESLDNNVYFNLPFVELNENKTFTELRLSKFIQSNSGNYDSVKFTQRIISTSVDTSAYNVILDSLQQNMIVYSSITDTGTVRIEYAFKNHLDSLMKDTLQVFINQVYPHPKLTTPYRDLCFGESLVLSASGGDTFKWSTGDTTTTITVSPAKTTMYKITVGRNGYSMDDSIQVKVENTPSKITLKSGWNIMSSPGYRQSTKIKSVFQSLIDNSSLLKIQDETGNSLEDWGIFGSWKDNIGDMFPTEGYKTKVSKNDSLEICGAPVQYPFAIPLKSGWNIMGYPQKAAYDGLEIVQQLIDRGKLIKAQDEAGNSIEDWGIFGGWKNNIYDFIPGKGYNIKLSADDTLWINESYTKSSAIKAEVIVTNHFKTVFVGNGLDHMNINLIGLPINILQSGDELAIFDGAMCVGVITLMPNHLQSQTASIAVSAKDYQGMPGFTEGNPIALKLWNSKQGKEYMLEPEIVKGTSTFAKHETTVASLEKYTATGLDDMFESKQPEINCYPNPFSDEVNIEIKLAKDSEVQVEVLNQLGQRVKTLASKQLLHAGINKFEWNGTNAGNQSVSTGIFHVKIEIGNLVFYKKIVFSK